MLSHLVSDTSQPHVPLFVVVRLCDSSLNCVDVPELIQRRSE